MMTYEQFLKQLRRIGIQFIVAGIVSIFALFQIMDFERAKDALLLSSFLFFIGLLI